MVNKATFLLGEINFLFFSRVPVKIKKIFMNLSTGFIYMEKLIPLLLQHVFGPLGKFH